jgi:hypothetical protein
VVYEEWYKNPIRQYYSWRPVNVLENYTPKLLVSTLMISSHFIVDFIKMDIEGSELNALKGAQNTIRKYKPILAICLYHRKKNLLTIPKYIHSLCPEYKFYLRAHSKFSQEIVLYAM